MIAAPTSKVSQQKASAWTMKHLHVHLQQAVEIEFWTIAYYLSVMYSITDPSHEAYRLIQSVAYQEMMHTQLISDICLAYGYKPHFSAPAYKGERIPILNFSIDTPDPREIYHPYSAEIGPLDEERINTMCLIEYPEWDTERQPNVKEDIHEYGSIGEFYAALRVGMIALREGIKGNARQIDLFRNYYRNYAQPAITRDGNSGGLDQALEMLNVIVDQGEGQTQGDVDIPPKFQNTADGYEESWPHYRKFTYVRNEILKRNNAPATYTVTHERDEIAPAQQRLIADFAAFLAILNALFCTPGATDNQGNIVECTEQTGDFGPAMAKIGGDILTCWKQGVVPMFSGV